jgi:hypothetical protein
MPEETLLDTTGSMGDNVDKAFRVLPDVYDMYMELLAGRYDVHMATGSFGDVQDGTPPPYFRTQFEMDVKVAAQMAMLVPSRNGCGNGKEDPQFGLFAGAYLTKARINQYPGMKRYHFTVSDEPVQTYIDVGWLKRLFGDDVLACAAENGFSFESGNIPDVAQVVKDLQQQAHAFFLQVGNRPNVTRQWRELYGEDHFVYLPNGTTDYLHYVKAVIVGLTEGILDLESVYEFLEKHGASRSVAEQVVRSVANIPIGAQMQAEAFDKMPRAGDIFRTKTDVWPLTSDELAEFGVDVAAIDIADEDIIDWI